MGWEVGGGVLETPEKRPTRGNSKKGENPRHSKGKIFLQKGKTNKQDETKQNKLIIQRKSQFQPRKLELVVE